MEISSLEGREDDDDSVEDGVVVVLGMSIRNTRRLTYSPNANMRIDLGMILLC